MSAAQKQTPAVGAGAAVEHEWKQIDCAAPLAVPQHLSRYAQKRQARLQADAALVGIALHPLADGSWLVSRWNLSKALADDQVEGWLARVGAGV